MSRRGSSGGGRSGGGARGYTRSAAPVRTAPPPERKATHTRETIIIRESPRGRQPGLFGTMAATAGGVAVGSAVGHTVGEAITGGSHRRAEERAPEAPQYSGPAEPSGPCAWEIKQFLQCAQSNDLSLCEGFNEAIKACKTKHGIH